MFFEVRFTNVLEITNNATADVRHISHEQRHRRPTICFDEIVNGTGATSTFFSKSEKVSVTLNTACIS